jgi:ubiquinone/menaquinone biosynthesis C-methylase UbiE
MMASMGLDEQPGRSVFDAAAGEYDAARPAYPGEVYDHLEAFAGPLAGQTVLDWGAGTGISGRQLAARGAEVTLLDIGAQMLRQARGRDPLARCVLADGHQMPVRDGSADLTTFAQSWHWFRLPEAQAEVIRVLRPGGHWAAWWNRPADSDEEWSERYLDVLEAYCPGFTWRHLKDDLLAPDWSGEAIRARGLVEPASPVVVQWLRTVSVEQWMTDERSKSYFISLAPDVREFALGRLTEIVTAQFPGGVMTIPYITTLLMARKVS